MPTDEPNPNILNHDWAILCTVNEDGEVLNLASPETVEGREDLIEYAVNEPAEDEAYERIADYLRSGKAVYSFETYFRITGANISQVGEIEKTRVDPSDFGVK